MIDLQKQIIDFLIKKGADLKSLEQTSNDLCYDTYKYLVEKGLNPEYLLKFATTLGFTYYGSSPNGFAYYVSSLIIDNDTAELRDQLIDLAIKHKATGNEIDNMNFVPSNDVLRKLLDNGFDPTKALYIVFNNNLYGKNINSEAISNKTHSLVNLTKVIIELGADLKNLSYVPNNLPYEIYELLLHKGFNPNELINIALGITAGEGRKNLIDLAIRNKANLNSINYFSSIPSEEELNYLLENGLNPTNALKFIVSLNIPSNDSNNKFDELKQNLIKFLLDKGANIDSIDYLSGYTSPDEYKFLLQSGLNPNKIIKLIIQNCQQAYKPNDEKFLSASFSIELKYILDLAVAKGGDVNQLIIENFNHASNIADSEGNILPYVIPHQIISQLIKENFLKPNTALEYAINNGLKELADSVIRYDGIDINARTFNGEETLIEAAILKRNMAIIDLLLENGAKKDINLLLYLSSVFNPEFRSTVKIVQEFSNVYNKEDVYTLLRSQGVSEYQVKNSIEFHELVVDYVSAINGNKTSLSLYELELLNPEVKSEIMENFLIEITNSYGFKPLHLAIIAGKYKLAENMIKSGYDIYAKSNSGITPLELVSRISDMLYYGYGENPIKNLISIVFDKIKNVDIDLGNGETLVDTLIMNQELASKVVEQTNDNLFYLFREDADLFSLSKHPDKTYIAISHGEGFWSSGAWSLARLVIQNHKNVVFHLVTADMVARGGEEFLRQFDAFINPGAGDSYPGHLKEFTKSDCPFTINIEHHYQNILEKSYQLKIPYLGMCAGAQHFSMYHGGSLKSLKGYDKGQHNITFIEGTLPHYLTLTEEQQQEAIKNCGLPLITVKGDTAHNFAAVFEKLGLDMQLGAVSEHNVPMAYAHISGIRFATQFHPEHHYGRLDINALHEKAWIDNFVSIAQMHHDYRVNNGTHPIDYYQKIQDRLETCIKQPTCLASDSNANIIGKTCLNQMIEV